MTGVFQELWLPIARSVGIEPRSKEESTAQAESHNQSPLPNTGGTNGGPPEPNGPSKDHRDRLAGDEIRDIREGLDQACKDDSKAYACAEGTPEKSSSVGL